MTSSLVVVVAFQKALLDDSTEAEISAASELPHGKLPKRRQQHLHLLELAESVGRPRRNLPTEINIQVTAPLFAARLYDYGPKEGDKELTGTVDASQGVDLSIALTFYGRSYGRIYILSNGAIGFSEDARSFIRDTLRKGSNPLIAPLWSRNDLRLGGQVFYREMSTGRAVDRARSEIRYQYDKTVRVSSVLLVTWSNMKPLNSASSDPSDKSNTFQAVVITTDNGTFANFIYKATGGSDHAMAGFTMGDGEHYYLLPGSRSTSAQQLKDFGNTGIPGEWIFRIDLPHRIVRCKEGIKGDTCDTECGRNEWGNDCENCCFCASGSCDSVTGRCEGECAPCWRSPPLCQHRDPTCPVEEPKCGLNAISFAQAGRCGQTIVRCQCMTGYEGDGLHCEDIDECKTNVCGANAQCTNTPGKYFCQCLSGFRNNGTVCVRMRETVSLIRIPTDSTTSTTTVRPTVTRLTTTTTYEPETTTGKAQAKFSAHRELASHQVPDSQLALPRRLLSHLLYDLKQPLLIFGKKVHKLTISSTGLISVNNILPVRYEDPIENSGIRGFAPFYGRIDLTQSNGTVNVQETTDSAVLTAATNVIGQHFKLPTFMASSVVMVSFENVSTSRNQGSNTFLVTLIGGAVDETDMVTFVDFMYENMQWSEGAQAMIITDSSESSLQLPGSGTDGVKLLSALSNIKEPGQWIFRVDKEKVEYCPEQSLRPPYCESSNQQDIRVPTGTKSLATAGFVQTFVSRVQSTAITSQSTRSATTPTVMTMKPKRPLDVPVKNRPPPPKRPLIQIVTPKPLVVLPAVTKGVSTTSAAGTDEQSEIQSQSSTETHEPIQDKAQILSKVFAPHNDDVPLASDEQTLKPVMIITGSVIPDTATTPRSVPSWKPHQNSNPNFAIPYGPPLKTSSPNVLLKQPVSILGRSIEDAEFDFNSPNNLAVIIPAAIVSIWLFLLLVIATAVFFRRRYARKHEKKQYDINFGYQGTATSHQYVHGNIDTIPDPMTSSEMKHMGQKQDGQVYSSYWSFPTDSHDFGYYNQSYYDSCPEVSRPGRKDKL